MRPVDNTVRKSQKFLQIAASIREIGIVQPPVVARRPELKGRYLLLDGHLRIDVLKDMGVAEAACLVSLDDEALTYNREVNPLTPVQEHRMILKVIGRGISEQRIAQALNVDVGSIRAKRDLLNGICPEVAALLKDKHCPINSFQALKKVKTAAAIRNRQDDERNRQLFGRLREGSGRGELPGPAGEPGQAQGPQANFSGGDGADRTGAGEPSGRDRTPSKRPFAADHLNLVLAASYVRSLLRNAEVDRYLRNYQEKLHRQFREICQTAAPLSEAAE